MYLSDGQRPAHQSKSSSETRRTAEGRRLCPAQIKFFITQGPITVCMRLDRSGKNPADSCSAALKPNVITSLSCRCTVVRPMSAICGKTSVSGTEVEADYSNQGTPTYCQYQPAEERRRLSVMAALYYASLGHLTRGSSGNDSSTTEIEKI